MILRTLALSVIITFFTNPSIAQYVKVIKFDSMEKLLKNDQDKVRVINFWATWCGPCVKELPTFEAINKNSDNVEVILVSLDFVEELDKVKRFVKKKELKSKIILLDEIDYNSWINQVSIEWSGAIPATLIIGPHATDKKFLEGELSADDLEQALQQFL